MSTINGIHRKDLTPFQAIMGSVSYETFTLAIIFINCITLTLVDPTLDDSEDADYLTYLNTVFNIIYVTDIVLQLLAFGFIKYLSNSWHYLDLVVGAVSALELGIGLIDMIALSLDLKPLNSKVLAPLIDILQITRVLRPLKAFKGMPSVMAYLMAIAKSMQSVMINCIFLLFTLASIATYFNFLVGDRLNNRCVPTDIQNANVTSNVYFQDYGEDIFYTMYNTQFCGGRTSCLSGFTCANINLPFETVPADFSTPWFSFISTFSFLTLRNWPNVFWAIADAGGMWRAFTVLAVMFLVGYAMVVNMFPAIFVASLRKEEQRVQKLQWLSYFPGNFETLSEFELQIWAANNKDKLELKKLDEAEVSILSTIFRFIWKCVDSNGHDIAMRKLKEDFARAKREDPNFRVPAINVGKVPWRPCVPHLRAWDIIRAIILPDDSYFSIFIIFLVFVNIILLSMDSLNPSELTESIQLYGDIFCNSVFGIELILKLVLLGPALYLDSAFNIMDAFLVVLGIMKYVGDLPTFVSNLRVIKLLRLIRLHRLSKHMKQKPKSKLSRMDTTINIPGLFMLVVAMMESLINTFLVSLLLMYMLALVGMKFLAVDNKCWSKGLTIGCGLEPLDPSAPAVIPFDLNNSWGGDSTEKMSFDSFFAAFATVFNIMFLNNWYNLMVHRMIQAGSSWVAWYFLLCVFSLNYFSLATLMSAATNIFESHAEDKLIEDAKANKYFLDNIGYLHNKLTRMAAFNVWKKNTSDSEKSDKKGEEKSAATTVIKDIEEMQAKKNVIVQFFINRKNHSLYIFAPTTFDDDGKVIQGLIRHYFKVVMESVLFSLLMWVAVMLVVLVIFVNSDDDETFKEILFYVNWYIKCAFLLEMLMTWIICGFYEYFKSSLNILDFLNNGIMIFATLFPQHVYLTQIRIIRLVKMGDIVRSFSQSHSLDMVVNSMYSSPSSVANLFAVGFLIVYFFSVIGLQTWLGAFGRCSYSVYPSKQGKDESSTEFPDGCNGMYNTVNEFGANVYQEIFWENPVNYFDNISTSFLSSMSIFMMNNWQPILYDAYAVEGYEIEPLKSANFSSAFFYFLTLGFLGIAVSVMFLAILYYHYVMISLTYGRKPPLNESSALWYRMEERLNNVKRDDGNIWSYAEPPKKNFLRHMLWRILQRPEYNYIIIMFCFGPVIALVGAYKQTYEQSYFIYYDTCFTIAYLGEWILRVWVLRKKIFYGAIGRQELLVVVALSLCLVYLVPFWGAVEEHDDENTSLLLRTCAIIRCYRLFYVSAEFNLSTKVLRSSLTGIVPAMIYYTTTVLIYSVLGVMMMSDLSPDYEDTYLNDRYNFKNYGCSIVTLMAIGSGNMYTQIVEAYMKISPESLSYVIIFYFGTYYIFVSVIMKSFALMTITKYLSHSSGLLGLPGQQIQQFKLGWDHIAKYASTISVTQMKRLVEVLPSPLGLKGEASKYETVHQFLRDLLLCMPSKASHFNDFEKDKKRYYYTETTLPNDVFDKRLPKWTFKQVLIALHKRALIPPSKQVKNEITLAEEDFSKKCVHKLREGVGRLVVEDEELRKNVDTFGDQRIQTLAGRSVLMLQRLDPDTYRNEFLGLIASRLDTMHVRIVTLGFGAYSAWLLSKLRGCLMYEERAAMLQLAVAKRMSVSRLDAKHATKEVFLAGLYHLRVKHILSEANKIYMSYAEPVWDPNSLKQLHEMRHKEGIRAIAVNSLSTIFVASGKSIWIYKHASYDPEITTSSHFRKEKALHFDDHVTALLVSKDGKRLFAGFESGDVIQFMHTGKGKGVSGSKYKRAVKPFSLHSGKITSLCYADDGETSIISTSIDTNIILWGVYTSEAEKVYAADSPVYCVCTSFLDKSKPSDEVPMSRIVIAGCQDGSIVVLPIMKAHDKDVGGTTWDAKKVDAHSSRPVSSVCSAWGYIYAGFADGKVKTWYIRTGFSSNVETELIGKPPRTSIKEYVNFDLVSSKHVHTSASTGLCYVGETLFSCSHDLSFIPFMAPEDVHAKTNGSYEQITGRGLIFHSNSILCMSHNKFILVSGDSRGSVLITTPSVKRVALLKEDAKTLKSEVSFSFLQYDFGPTWCAHQNIVPEQECHLVITNNSVHTVSIRCLFSPSLSKKFKVEVGTVQNKPMRVLRGTKMKSMYNLSGKESIKFRIIFFPAEDSFYETHIDFLVNETEKIAVQVKGRGVFPKLEMKSSMQVLDFGTVIVDSSRLMTLDLFNNSEKSIITHLVEGDVHPLCIGGEPFQLPQRNISVTPRAFKIRARASIRLHIVFNPQEEYESFEVPLIFAVAGAFYTLSSLRFRSAHPRLLGDGSKTLKLEENYISTIPQTLREQPRNLRLLNESENLSRDDLVSPLLELASWRSVVYEGLVVFSHEPTGTFLEIFEYSEDQLTHHSEPIDELNISFANGDNNVYCECWHHSHLLSKAYVAAGEEINMVISAEQLMLETMYQVDQIMKECKVDSAGTLVLDFKVFTVGTHERNPAGEQPVKETSGTRSDAEREKYGSLMSTSFLRVYKGFRVVRAAAGEPFVFLDRLVFAGIERVVSWSSSGVVHLDEEFGGPTEATGKHSSNVVSIFPLANLGVDCSGVDDVITHFNVESTITERLDLEEDVKLNKIARNARTKYQNLEKEENDNERNAPTDTPASTHEVITSVTSETFPIDSITGKEIFDIQWPLLAVKAQIDYAVSRRFKIETLCSHILRGKTKSERVQEPTIICGHTSVGLVERGHTAYLAPSLLCPHEIFSDNYSIRAAVVEPTSRGQEFDSERYTPVQMSKVLDQLFTGSRTPVAQTHMHELESRHLFNGQWYLVNDNHSLSLISTEVPKIGSFNAELEVATTSARNDVSIAAKNSMSSKPVVSEKACTEIELTCHGFFARLENCTKLHSGSGFVAVVPEENLMDLSVNSNVVKHFRYFDSTGQPSRKKEVSPYMLKLFEGGLRSASVNMMKTGFLKLLDAKEEKQRIICDRKAQDLIRNFEEELKIAQEASGILELNTAQLKEQKRVSKEAAHLRNSIFVVKSPENVFKEVQKYVKTFDPPDATKTPENAMLLKSLQNFVTSVSLPGSEAPVSKALADCAFRTLNKEKVGEEVFVTMGGFKKWYKEEFKSSDVNAMSVYSLLHEEKRSALIETSQILPKVIADEIPSTTMSKFIRDRYFSRYGPRKNASEHDHLKDDQEDEYGLTSVEELNQSHLRPPDGMIRTEDIFVSELREFEVEEEFLNDPKIVEEHFEQDVENSSNESSPNILGNFDDSALEILSRDYEALLHEDEDENGYDGDDYDERDEMMRSDSENENFEKRPVAGYGDMGTRTDAPSRTVSDTQYDRVDMKGSSESSTDAGETQYSRDAGDDPRNIFGNFDIYAKVNRIE